MAQRILRLSFAVAACMASSVILAADVPATTATPATAPATAPASPRGNAGPTETPEQRLAAVLTPSAPATPRINGARRYGERTGHPFLYTIPATGDRPMTFAAEGLPSGLTLDEKTGFIRGSTSDNGSHKVKLTVTNAKGSASAVLDIVIGDQICLTPQLGWNSWNKFATNVTEADVRGAADAMVSSGLINHGWTYINIDDAWEVKPNSTDPRLGGPTRDADGHILTNKKFPDMKALGDYVHGQGLKFGVYSSPGPQTCARYEATYQHEDEDAQTYADWGVDYVKYDWCSYGQVAQGITLQRYEELLPDHADELKTLLASADKLSANRRRTPEQESQLKDVHSKLDPLLASMDQEKKKQIDLEILQQPYRKFRSSLDKVNRDIVFSFCQYGMGDVWKWGADAGGNSWRTTGDINASWRSIAMLGFSQNGHEPYAGPGHWNDPDMLEVGNGRLTSDEMYTHMTLWSILASPLLIGCDMTKMDALTTSMFSNDEVLAVNQDALGKQGWRAKQDGETEVWMKPMADGTMAVGLFNRGAEAAKVSVAWSDLKLEGAQAVRDLWRETDLPQEAAGYSTMVNSHGAALVRVGTPKAE